LKNLWGKGKEESGTGGNILNSRSCALNTRLRETLGYPLVPELIVR
jgi:hypothetical protein